MVVMTGRAGKNPPPGTMIALSRSDRTKLAFGEIEREFRRVNDIRSNVALRSSILFEGTDEECETFYTKLCEKMKEEECDSTT